MSTHLPAEAASVRRARALLREVLADVAAEAHLEAAELALSELVTNAIVHAGTEVGLRIDATPARVRVEVADGSRHAPVRRAHAVTAGTGRGLHLLDQTVDRWDAVMRADGKVVWFEIGSPTESAGSAPDRSVQTSVPGRTRRVLLRNVPLLMHWAWQEHAAALLREHLLLHLDEDESLDDHARASDALDLLREQVPHPALTEDDTDALMATAVEPGVTAAELELLVPIVSVMNFEVLDRTLQEAVREADAGLLLNLPTQPEISEMREWFCEQVLAQSGNGSVDGSDDRSDDRSDDVEPWRARTEVRASLTDGDAARRHYAEFSESAASVLVTDERSVIVAASDSALEFLRYRDREDLLGRRVLAVVPARFHQAHIAGTTLHMTNGRDVLLDVAITVPVLRADGTEVVTGLRVSPHTVGGDRVFVASFELSD